MYPTQAAAALQTSFFHGFQNQYTLLQKEMSRHDIGCEELEFCYKELSRYYTLKKKNMISEAILKMID